MLPPQGGPWRPASLLRSLQLVLWLVVVSSSSRHAQQPQAVSASAASASSSADEYDFIVVGGGSAGSIVAARLASASHSVLLLEAGGPTQRSLSGSALVVHPNLTLFDVPLYWTDITANPLYAAQFEWELRADPAPQVARGLGGCSVHNAMIYIRGLDRDFDDWGEDWDYSSVLPAYRRSVQQQDPELRQSPLHAPEPGPGGLGGGEVHLSTLHSDDRDPVAAQFIASCLQSGMEELRDFNGAHRREGAGYYQFLIRDGQRETPASALYGSEATMPHRSRLRILTFAQATRLIFDTAGNQSTPRAVGVQYALLPQSPQSSLTSSSHTLATLPLHAAYARREVVLSAGAINSAKLLLLSGIGPRAALDALSIPVLRHLPGVGRNAMDGSKVNMQWEAPSVYFHPCIPHEETGGRRRHEKDEEDVRRQQSYCQHALQTFFAARQQSAERKQRAAAAGEATHSAPASSSSSSSSSPLPPLSFGIMGTPGFSAGAFLKVEPQPQQSLPQRRRAAVCDLPAASSQLVSLCVLLLLLLLLLLQSHSALERPNVQLTVFPWDKAHREWRERVTGVVTMEVASNNPSSRGRVSLSSRDWFEPPVVDFNYLGSRQDVDALLWAVKRVREIVAVGPLNQTLLRETLPGPARTDAELREYIRCGEGGDQHCDASQRVVGHLAGTVQMGDPRVSRFACVDSRLRVIGVDGLRVADASVMPLLPSGNTHATCMMIGERAAEFLLQRVRGDESSRGQQRKRDEEEERKQRSVEGGETLWAEMASRRGLLLALLFAAPLTAGYCCLSLCWSRAGSREEELSRSPLLSEQARREGGGGTESAINNE